jgi:hypothetical protein
MPKPSPPGWGQDKLAAFLNDVHSNQQATFHNMKDRYAQLQGIDECFFKVGTNLINPKNALAGLFMLRSHSAYRAACATAMSGQASETFVLLRSCLEYAGYALRINTKPQLGKLWLNRHKDAESLGRVRNEFSNANVQAEVIGHSKKIGGIYHEMYERAVDFGGHPNDRAVTGSLKILESGDAKKLTQVFLHAGDLAMKHALKSTAQVGLCSLHIFQLIFTEKFEILGVRADLENLRKAL